MKGRSSAGAGAPDALDIYTVRQVEAIAARWDARARAWDRHLEDPTCHLNEDDAYNRFLRLTKRFILRRKAFCAGHGVVDAGCGTGLVIAEVISSFAWGIGVDISSEMIRAAKAKHILNSRFLEGDCFELAKFCNPAGAVLSRGVLLSHYGPQHGQKLLESARSILTPGGFAIFDFLNERARTAHRHAPEEKSWFTAQQACALAKQAGFQEVRVIGQPERRVLLLLGQKAEDGLFD
jgi:SAM-dependent methyltransferase